MIKDYLIGEILDWQDENQQPFTAEVIDYIRPGKISDVFRARVTTPENAKHEYMAVKVEKPDIVVTESDEQFLDEYELLSQLRDITEHVPKMYSTDLENFPQQTAYVMEYLSPAMRWASQGEQILKNFHSAIEQYLTLFDAVVATGIINKDIKPENFYWLEAKSQDEGEEVSGRFILLDWNRCSQSSDEHATSKIALSILSNLISEIYVGENLPNPLPSTDLDYEAVKIKSEEKFYSLPRPLRRFVIASKSPLEFSLNQAKDLNDWLQAYQALSLKAKSEQDQTRFLFDEIDKYISDYGVTESEKLEKAKDIFELLPPEAANQQSYKIYQKKISNFQSGQEISSQDEVAKVREKIETTNFNAAIQLSKEIIVNGDVPRRQLWELARWHALAVWMKWRMDYGGVLNINKEEAQKAVRFFSGELHIQVEQDYLEMSDRLDTAKELFNQQYSLGVNINQDLNTIEAIESAIESLRSHERFPLPEVSLQALRAGLPYYDRVALLAQKNTIESYLQRNEQHLELQRRLEQTFTKSPIAFQDLQKEIAEAFQAHPVHLSGYLAALFNAHQAAMDNDFDRTLTELDKFPDEPLVTQYLKSLKQEIVVHLLEYDQSILYRSDIDYLHELLPQIGAPDLNPLGQRISILEEKVEATDPFEVSLEELNEYQKEKLEPWAVSEADSSYLIKNLIKFSQLQLAHQNLLNSEKIISKTLGEETMEDLSLRAEHLSAKFDDLVKQLKKMMAEIETLKNQSTQVENDISELERINNSVKTLTQRSEDLEGFLASNSQKLSLIEEKIKAASNTAWDQLKSDGKLSQLSNQLLLLSLTDLVGQGEFSRAIEILEKEKARLGGARSHVFDSEYVDSWIAEIKRLDESPSVADYYKAWISFLNEKDEAQSNVWLNIIINDDPQKSPLFEYLFLKHHLLFGSVNGTLEPVLGLFYNGKLNEANEEYDKVKDRLTKFEHISWLNIYELTMRFVVGIASKEDQILQYKSVFPEMYKVAEKYVFSEAQEHDPSASPSEEKGKGDNETW